MKTIIRGLRGVVRSPMRTVLLTILLTVSISLSLIMLVVGNAFDDQIAKIRSEVGTDIHMNPSGAPEPGVAPTMPEEAADQFLSVQHVSSVSKRLSQSLPEDAFKGAKLTDAGKKLMAARGMTDEQIEDMADSFDTSVVGSNIPENLFVRGRTTSGFGVVVEASPSVEVVGGRTFTAEEMNDNVCLIGKRFAEANNLNVGDVIDISGEQTEIIGIFTADDGDVFGQNTIFMPLESVQRIFDKDGIISSFAIYADDAENVGAVVASINSLMESPNYTTNEGAYKSVAAPLSNAKNSSQIGMYSSLIACVVIILFAVIMSVRGRVKEIGILKAVGASNGKVTLQFGVETLVTAVLAAILGAVATVVFAENVAGIMVGGALSDTVAAGAVQVSVSPEVFVLSLGLSVTLALIGCCFPAWSVSRIKPAQVLRFE